MEVFLHVEYVLSCRGVMYVQFQYGTICPSAQPLALHHAGYSETQSRVGPKKESGLLINTLRTLLITGINFGEFSEKHQNRQF